MEDHKFISAKQAAEIIGLSYATLKTRRSKGLPPRFFRMGKKVLYHLDDLNEFVRSCIVSQDKVGE